MVKQPSKPACDDSSAGKSAAPASGAADANAHVGARIRVRPARGWLVSSAGPSGSAQRRAMADRHRCSEFKPLPASCFFAQASEVGRWAAVSKLACKRRSTS
jgi:hypothetical protein